MKRLALGLGLVALAAVLAACSGGSSATSAPPASAGGGTGGPTVVAKDMHFQPTEVAVTAGAPVSLVFDNQDSAPHNIKISDASGAEVFKGEIVTKSTVTYAVPTLTAGSYPFVCEVHPDMKGTITAS